ncbi:hypothetical protein ECANGB1_404 [Enterospora canceri]|uniref:Uncharacterized protein n=1 Tax=Enterospora canceri TaxID=1081671 RepID=A0A1Y1S5K4_9MICR|nr:hypothetical protein ECANGB1_404 [Enterospora canceri]
MLYQFIIVSLGAMQGVKAETRIDLPEPSETVIINDWKKQENKNAEKHKQRSLEIRNKIRKDQNKRLKRIARKIREAKKDAIKAGEIEEEATKTVAPKSEIKLNMSKNLEKILETNKISLPEEMTKKKVEKVEAKKFKVKKMEKVEKKPQGEKIIIVKESKGDDEAKKGKVAEKKEKDKPEGSLSNIMFSSTIKTKEEILRSKDSLKLMENNNKIRKIIAQLKIITDENEKILDAFRANVDEKREEEDKPKDVMKYKVIEVTEKP